MAKSLSALINSAFILTIIIVILLIPGLFINTELLIVKLEQFILFLLVLPIIWNFRVIASGFKNNLFYEKKIFKALQYLSLLLIFYVLVAYGFYLFKNQGENFVNSGYAIVDFIEIYIKPIKFSHLLLSAVSFLLSFAVSEGLELKEENNLTV